MDDGKSFFPSAQILPIQTINTQRYFGLNVKYKNPLPYLPPAVWPLE